MRVMDKKTIQTRKKLGYEISEEDSPAEKLALCTKIPSWVFGYSALASFVAGILGMAIELSDEEMKYLFLYFSLSFLLAPALLVYPIFRYVLGEGKTGLSAILSALFGYYFQSNIKKKMDKWS